MEGSFLSASIPMRTLCSSPDTATSPWVSSCRRPPGWGFPVRDPSWIDRDENGNATLTPDRLAQLKMQINHPSLSSPSAIASEGRFGPPR